MIHYEGNQFEEIFTSLGISQGDVVMVHSSLINFGIPTDMALSKLPEKILDLLLKRLGREGTLVVPTFNFDFCKGIDYNKHSSKSQRMGAFSEFVRKHPQSERSKHPTQSVAVIGKLKSELTRDDTISPFCLNSPFDKMTRLDTKLLLLGSDFNSLSIVHMEEEAQKVPYRFWKTFTGMYKDLDVVERREYKMYVRNMHISPVLDFSDIYYSLKEKQKVKEESLGAGKVISLCLSDFREEVSGRLKSNPYFYVSNHPDFLKRI